MSDTPKKLLILCTHGPEDWERSTIPFVMATAAQASDIDVVIGLQVNAVWLAKKGEIDKINAPEFPPLKDLYEIYIGNGGKLLVCGPCMKSRNINHETDFVRGATVVNAATFIKEAIEAVNVLNY